MPPTARCGGGGVSLASQPPPDVRVVYRGSPDREGIPKTEMHLRGIVRPAGGHGGPGQIGPGWAARAKATLLDAVAGCRGRTMITG